MVVADGKLLVLKNDGELLVVPADPADYKELARLRLTRKPVWAYIAPSSGRIYIKDSTDLLCFELP